jgi:hypothetical protein
MISSALAIERAAASKSKFSGIDEFLHRMKPNEIGFHYERTWPLLLLIMGDHPTGTSNRLILPLSAVNHCITNDDWFAWIQVDWLSCLE